MLSQGQRKLRFLPPHLRCHPCGTSWSRWVSFMVSTPPEKPQELLLCFLSRLSWRADELTLCQDVEFVAASALQQITTALQQRRSMEGTCLWGTSPLRLFQGGQQLMHPFFLPFFFNFDQQLSLKINLLKSPRRFVTAPQSLTALGGSCCSTANPLTPLSPPGKASCSWG